MDDIVYAKFNTPFIHKRSVDGLKLRGMTMVVVCLPSVLLLLTWVQILVFGSRSLSSEAQTLLPSQLRLVSQEI